jgi:cytochrome c-type biogenesis protein CcmH/NrfG
MHPKPVVKSCPISLILQQLFFCLFIPVSIVAFSPFVYAQMSPIAGPVVNASTALNAGNYAAAIQMLTQYLKLQPADIEALRLLAKAYYWSGNTARALSTYEQAIAIFPDSANVRLDYSRMLIETGDTEQATILLGALRSQENVASEAEALLGTAVYWEGDWTQAKLHFERALQMNPSQAEAKRQLNEIQIASAPTVTLEPSYQSDTQPLYRWFFIGELKLHDASSSSFNPRTDSTRQSCGHVTFGIFV